MLFICNSPYHVFNAINYKLHYSKEDDDMILINMFNNSDKVYKSLSDSGLFNKVVYISDCGNDKTISWLELLWPEHFLKDYVDLSELRSSYSKVVVASYLSNVSKCICCHYSNRSCGIEMIEDGMGTYIYGIMKYRRVERLFGILFNRGFAKLRCKNLYVYDRSLIEADIPYKLLELPKLERTQENVQKIGKLFEANDSMEIKEQYIFIFESEIYGITTQMQVSILNDLKEAVGIDNIIVKPHPKTDLKLLAGYKLLKGQIPWEAYCFNNEMDSKVVVAMNSTAAFTPKLVFGDKTQIWFVNDYSAFEGSSYSESCKMLQRRFAKNNLDVEVCRIRNLEDMVKHIK